MDQNIYNRIFYELGKTCNGYRKVLAVKHETLTFLLLLDVIYIGTFQVR